ncbi:DUF1275 domain-containing protein [Sphingomonas parva]|uniref:DUF1275 domain-containing protein n=2 Tax=Sphingomonas parva TaxID=2555898 RepID=A0A4Y8ZUX3_9SPHN|nr:DUF1275 domain-containing protein [Sphingomonas parva]
MLLSALAGFVDAVAFLELGGFFVSFMSGNSTRLAVGIAGDSPAAATAAGLIGAFVLGVTAGALVGAAGGRRRAASVLLFVAALLGLAAASGLGGAAFAAALLLAAAMGAENAVFEKEGEVRIGLTYMTGTLVKLGQRIAATLRGADATGWGSFLLLWAGFVGGAVLGALARPALGLAVSLAAAAGAAGLLALVAWSMDEA